MPTLQRDVGKLKKRARFQGSWVASALTLLQPFGTGLAALLAVGILVAATRQGQLASIAAFGAGVAVAAIVSAFAGGGTTLAFSTGDLERQQAVRTARNYIVMPAILASTGIAVLTYMTFSSLGPLALAAGGLATAFNVYAELDATYLRRQLRTVSLLGADLSNKIVGFGLILAGADFAYVMLAGAAMRCCLLAFFSRSDPSRSKTRITLARIRIAYEARLTGMSIAYVVIDRVGALFVPFTAPSAVAGGFTAVIGIQQNVSGVLMSGVQTLLAARTETGRSDSWTSRIELLFILAAVAACGVMLAFADVITSVLGLGAAASPGSYWSAIALLVPLSISSRIFDFRAIAFGRIRTAVISRAFSTGLVLVGAAVGLLNDDVSVLSWSLVVGELGGLVASIALRVADRRVHRKD